MALLRCLLLALLCSFAAAAPGETLRVRPPAVPLVVHDPYFSVWSMADRLTDQPTRHWTGAEQPLAGLARIDGTAYRFIGTDPPGVPAMEQVSLEVGPTRTRYRFAAGGVELDLAFVTPAFADDLDLLSRPLTYLVWDLRATDGRTHEVSLYFDASAVLATDTPDQRVTWRRERPGDLDAVRVGTVDQPVLAKAGDDLRIDWGWLYLATPAQSGAAVATDRTARDSFARTGAFPEHDIHKESDGSAAIDMVLAAAFDLGAIAAAPVSRHLMLAYDDLFSVELVHVRLRPWWRRHGTDAGELLRRGADDYAALAERARSFDRHVTAELTRAGGAEYAALAALAYRQTLGAHKLVAGPDGAPLLVAKENFSNGCIGTVDVTYPSSPFFLLFNPRLLEAQLAPVLDYASSPRWRWPFAPHDLGTYPLADGQVYGGRETSDVDQMPVEESGDILIMLAALARIGGTTELAARYWPLLTRWAAYLRDEGLDPKNQLSTDDFAGHLAGNANLSIKAIVALGAYALLAERLGHREEAPAYRHAAEDMARRWQRMAADGDHFMLAFGRPGTWSQKYNLIWDRLLGLRLFPPDVSRREIAFYETHQNRYGLPLDSRATYTKLDWTVWSATLAQDPRDFAALVGPLFRWMNETPARVPLTDWFDTVDGRQRGFQARSVVGGVYVKALARDCAADRPQTTTEVRLNCMAE